MPTLSHQRPMHASAALERAVHASSALELAEHALHAEGRLAAARGWFDAACRESEAARCPQTVARAALGMGGIWVHERRLTAEAAGIEARQRRALQRVGPGSALGMRLQARLTAEHGYRTGDASKLLALVDQLRPLDEPIALAEALSLAHHCLLGPEYAASRLHLAEDLLGVATATGSAADLLMGLVWRTVDLLLCGDPTAERSLAELRSACDRQGHLAVGFVVSSIDVMLAVRPGRWDEAETLVAEAAARGRAAGDADAASWPAAQLLGIRWFQGRAGELAPAMADLAHSGDTGVVDRASFAALAVALATSGDAPAAACALARMRGWGFADQVRTSGWQVGMYGAVETAYLLDDRDLAAEADATLHPYARLP